MITLLRYFLLLQHLKKEKYLWKRESQKELFNSTFHFSAVLDMLIMLYVAFWCILHLSLT